MLSTQNVASLWYHPKSSAVLDNSLQLMILHKPGQSIISDTECGLLECAAEEWHHPSLSVEEDITLRQFLD